MLPPGSSLSDLDHDTCDFGPGSEFIKVLTICDQGKYSHEAIGKKDEIIEEMRILLKQIDRNIS